MNGLGVTERGNIYLQSHVGVALFDAQKEEGSMHKKRKGTKS